MYHISLSALGFPGSQKMEFVDLDVACEAAYGFSLPGKPCKVWRDPEFTDLAATVWHDGGIDFSR